jgi:hypothetical protein
MSLKSIKSIDPSKFMDEAEIDQALSDMEQDDMLNTKPILVRGIDDTEHHVAFSEPHAAYLKAHPKVDPKNYLSNLKAMIRKRI